MSSIKKYLTPINPDDLGYHPSEYAVTLGSKIKAYTPGTNLPAMPKGGLVLLGVEEDRGAINNAGCASAPNEIRRYLYQLALPTDNTKVVDYGNILIGQIPDDTYYAVSEVVASVLSKGNALILLGGSQDLTFAAYKGYEKLRRIMNISAIDPRFDLENTDETTSRSWLRNIIMQNPNYLFFHSNVGFQTYYVGQAYIKLMDELKFDAYRLGEVQHDMKRTESLIRNADLLSVDVSAIRQSDAPGNGYPSPHGFYGEEYCQMMRFAGMSDKTNCLGIFEFNPLYDNHGQTANMLAQGIWYFIEGFYNRKHDDPKLNPQNCKHFIVQSKEQGIDIHFYKSKLSDRWWMQVPCDKEELREIYSDQLMLPCTYADYEMAMQGELPAIWWRYFKRLNS
ncbi:MAG: formimidoylglutamase [Bacteroidales bacterium]|jgi:arginase family enzyme|nr:formimidoylglutamase [Bacteroidales bacterium]MBR3987068.1 formimidoylglutamase [Bacteroidales bacterium]